MQYKPQVGHPLTLTNEVKARLLDAVSIAFRPETIANYAMVAPPTLRRWLKKGQEDATNGIGSEYSQFWLEFNKKKADKVVQWLKDVEQRLPNWQATWELVRTVAREDFGVEAVEYKELLDLYTQLKEAFNRFSENPLQGAVSHGREMDTKGSEQE